MNFEDKITNVKEVGTMVSGKITSYGQTRVYLGERKTKLDGSITIASGAASIPQKYLLEENREAFIKAFLAASVNFQEEIKAEQEKKKQENALEIANLEAEIKANEGSIERIKSAFEGIELPTKWQNAVKKSEDEIAALKAKIDRLLA